MKAKLKDVKTRTKFGGFWTALIATVALVHPMVAVAAFSHSNFVTSASEPKGPRPMTASELTTTFGGVSVTAVAEPDASETSALDNMQIDVSINNNVYKTGNAYVVAYANDSKVQAYLVSTPAPNYTARLQSRMSKWPTTNGSGRTFSVETCDNFSGGSCYEWPDFDRTSVKINGSLHVAWVRYHNLQEQSSGISSSFSHTTALNITDNLDWTYRNTTTPYTSSMDVIYNQCSGSNDWNFRYDNYSAIVTVPNNCTMIRVGNPNPALNRCDNYKSVFDGITSNTKDKLHVFWINSFEYWEGGVWKGAVGIWPGGDRDWVLAVDSENALNTSVLIAHEFGHAFGISGHNTTDCDGVGTDYVMCAGGTLNNDRLFAAGECTTINSNTTRVADIN